MVTTLNVEPLRTGYAASRTTLKAAGDKGHMGGGAPARGQGRFASYRRPQASNDTTSVVPSYQLEVAYLDSLPDSPSASCNSLLPQHPPQRGHAAQAPHADEVPVCRQQYGPQQIIEFGIATGAQWRGAGIRQTARTSASTRCSLYACTWTRVLPLTATQC